MASWGQKVEYFVGRSLSFIRNHDDRLFTRCAAFREKPQPTLDVSCIDCEGAAQELQLDHTPMGENRFPSLKWKPLETDNGNTGNQIVEYLVIVEDPDAPLPQPVVHGIYFGIPHSKTTLCPEDFQLVPDGQNTLAGGFGYGLNRMKTVWGGPKPVLGHGPHRYMFQVISLRSQLDRSKLGQRPTKTQLERAVEGEVVSWGTWIGTYERKL